ncbi:hypothetical protein DXF96_00575 [Heyndrickxia coagulans]|nr:hypothetical protein DXF96_00575 [Heyndrickxia coagulans]
MNHFTHFPNLLSLIITIYTVQNNDCVSSGRRAVLKCGLLYFKIAVHLEKFHKVGVVNVF